MLLTFNLILIPLCCYHTTRSDYYSFADDVLSNLKAKLYYFA